MNNIGTYEIIDYIITIDDILYDRQKINYYDQGGNILNTVEYYGNDSEIEDGYEFTSNDNIKLIEYYRKKYSRLISNIDGMKEAIERSVMDGTPIPVEITTERERLKTEYHTITDPLI